VRSNRFVRVRGRVGGTISRVIDESYGIAELTLLPLSDGKMRDSPMPTRYEKDRGIVCRVLFQRQLRHRGTSEAIFVALNLVEDKVIGQRWLGDGGQRVSL
jgi:hypothetical protein